MADDFLATLAGITGNKKLVPPVKPAVSDDIDVSDLLTKMKGGVLQTENSGNYQGPRNKRTGAVGGFQVLPDNIPSWTAKYYNKQLTPDEFERDTAAQDAVFNGEMGKYLRAARKRGVDDRTAIRMGAAQWYGGEGAIDRYDDPKRFRPNEASFQEYTNLVANRSLKGQLPPVAQESDFPLLGDAIQWLDNYENEGLSQYEADEFDHEDFDEWFDTWDEREVRKSWHQRAVDEAIAEENDLGDIPF